MENENSSLFKKNKAKQEAEERAERIRRLRENVLRLTRDEFCTRNNLSVSSLRNWEEPRNSGLTHNSVSRLVAAFRAEGVECDINWLLHGEGINPELRYLLDSKDQSDELLRIEELQLFCRLHKNAEDAMISDDALAPYFMPGYLVAGERFFHHDIYKAIGLPCIVQTQSGQVLTRLVTLGDMPDYYTLVCSNPKTTVTHPIIKNVKLISAAPIIWSRRPKIT